MSDEPRPERGAAAAGEEPPDEHRRTLVRTEQKLFLSQRDLSRQIRRLDTLNRFTVEATGLSEPRHILLLAAETLLSLFPYDQALGFSSGQDGWLQARAWHAAPGSERSAWERFEELEDASFVVGDLTCDPYVGSAERLHGAGVAADGLLCALEDVYRATDEIAADAPCLLLPILGGPDLVIGALLLRRLSPQLSFHEELPSSSSPFLSLVARNVAAAMTNAELVADLKASYADLAHAQRELVERERLAALGSFAAIVAHEVRNPLAAIYNALSMLGREVPSGGTGETLLTIAQEEATRLDKIVNDLLDFASPHPATLAPTGLRRVVLEAVETVLGGVGASDSAVQIDVPEELPHLNVDARMLRQALINLIENARHASGEDELVVVRALDGGALVHIEVEDRGAGIDAAVLGQVFEPFFTTKATGTGLGLAVVKRVAEAHGHPPRARSERGVGSTFSLTLSKA